MNDLVKLENGIVTVDSLKVSVKFEKDHKDVLKAIRNLECSDDFKSKNFLLSSYTNTRGRTVPCYELTRDGFSFLCMGFKGKKAAQWKEGFIKAFNSMERELLKQQDKLEWKQARLQSKDVRKSITSTIRDFVDYATGQGSKSASMYYANITKMEYAALELVDKGGKIPTGFRNTLDSMDLCFLMTAEQIAKQTLMHGMNEGLHYKEIYQLAKQRVMNYAESVKMPRLEKL